MKKQDIINLKLNPTDKPDYYYLMIDEYILILAFLPFYRLAIMSSVTSKKALGNYLNRLYIHNDDIKRAYLIEHDLGIVLNYRRMDQREFEAILKNLVLTFKELKIHTVDRFTKQPGVLYPAFMAEDIEIVSRQSFAKQEREHQPKKSQNAGLLSAFLLGLIGSWMFAHYHKLGLIVSLSGIIIGLCTFFGYLWLGERMDKKGIIGSVVISAVDLLIGQVFATAISIKDGLVASTKNTMHLSLFETLPLVSHFLVDQDVIGAMLPYLGLTLLFVITTILICFSFYKKGHLLKNTYILYDQR